MAVGSPFDILELRDGGELVTRVLAFEEGPVVVTPRDGRAPKVVQGIRLHVPMEDKQTAPPWWDVTAQTVKPTLLAVLPRVTQGKLWLKLHKYGDGAGARFGVDLLPPDYTGGPRADTKNMAGP